MKLRVHSVRLIENPMMGRSDTVVKCHTFDGGQVETWGMISYGEGLYWISEDACMREWFAEHMLEHYNSYLDRVSWGYTEWLTDWPESPRVSV